MKQSIWTSGQPANPQAFITKRKQRVKQFEGQVYLNDGDEYEIEIFNPQPNYILAKIKVDNSYLSGGGIVLRPGERVFLERFLDSNNKFVFRTYQVGKEAVNLGATDNNGYVEIQFFSEWKQTPSPYWSSSTPYVINTLGNVGLGCVNPSTTLNVSSTSTSTFYNTSLTSTNTFAGPNIRSIETGTTEKGNRSNQEFKTTNRDFYSYSFHNVAWRILPVSVKKYHREELSVAYCGECGAKRKKDTHKFCPHCGTKF